MSTRTTTTNEALMQRRTEAIPRGVANACGVFPDRAENAEIWDVEGRRFIDFAGGIAVLNAGHLHPAVKAAVAAQMERFTHTCFQVMPYDSYVELAERLNELAPGAGPHKTIFLTTGAEAVENAVKIARRHTGRPGIVSFGGAFHGRTAMTLAMTGKTVPYKDGFEPLPGQVFRVPYPMEYRRLSSEHSLLSLEHTFKTDIAPERVAAIFIEPVLGEGGFYPAPADFMQALRRICDEHGILLVSDEIQAGIARTGKMFACEHSGIEPDLMTIAKSIAAGLPISAVTGRAEIMDAVPPGGLGGTYGGNPVACAAGLAVLDVIEKEGLLDRARSIGRRISDRLTAFSETRGGAPIGDVRGLGAMNAIELVKDRETREPDPQLTKRLTQEALDRGLLLLACGLYGNVIRILVPLTAPDALVDEGLGILEASLEASLEEKTR